MTVPLFAPVPGMMGAFDDLRGDAAGGINAAGAATAAAAHVAVDFQHAETAADNIDISRVSPEPPMREPPMVRISIP